MNDDVRKIAFLPGAQLRPQPLLASLLEHAGDMASIAVTIQWHGGDVEVGWSSQTVSELALKAVMLHEEVVRATRGVPNALAEPHDDDE